MGTVTKWPAELYEVVERPDGSVAARFVCSRPGCKHRPVYKTATLARMIEMSDGPVVL